MLPVIEEIKALFQSFSKAKVKNIYKLAQSGSDREYFRIEADNENYIATHNQHIKENKTFLYFSNHFKQCHCPVPDIYTVNKKRSIYIQQDFGDNSLLSVLEQKGQVKEVYSLFQKSLQALATLQINGDKNLDYEQCITSKEFGKQAIVSDLLYFKYYFLDTLKIPYDKEKLIDNFEALSTYLSHADHKFFMFRDFQSRNIMIQNDDVHFIDYQGGMKGALQYDVASLLWQAKAELSDEWKNNLLNYYMDCVEDVLQNKIDRNRFESQYNGYVLIRLLQVLGAYGFRGLFERKAHFLSSIPLALRNLKWFLENKQIGIGLNEFERLLKLVVDDKIIDSFEPIKATPETPLAVSINSFSYKKGIPIDTSDNGGGFVLDCRAILNPGRIEEYKKLSGLDKEVKTFLEQQTEMPAFLNSVYDLVDISVTDYLKRGFDHLQINFGCTGGQHRSVYAAEALARHLKNKYGVKVNLLHTNKDNWVR